MSKTDSAPTPHEMRSHPKPMGWLPGTHTGCRLITGGRLAEQGKKLVADPDDLPLVRGVG